ncbi:dipeptidyl-peptidase 3 family protein [Paraliomyxa miuraensis]|uniref:dipeptidyl-peptidase 3 family protein n=1 Tax=Paraliomyxa miuraensis TaxID=376150 RepID=UPI0022596826|nr:hypothetical protein [Paraliomyxa miuraensis]MCX4247574.1 hypothetical protein [Paraliomyxa miuraensis]
MSTRSVPFVSLARLFAPMPLLLTLACGGGSGEGKDGKKVEAKTAAGDAKAGDAKSGDAKAGEAKAGDAKAGDTKAGEAPNPEAAALGAKIDQFAIAELTVDTASLSESERQTLSTLIEAAKLMDPIFDRQAWVGNPKLESKLSTATDPVGKAKYAYFRIMRGPWDRQNHREPFAVTEPWPKGAGFYPEDLTAEEFKAWVADHPKDAGAFEGLYTVIARDNQGLRATPYSESYAEWLDPAAAKLREAAEHTENASLAKFLRSRADAFGSDDYYGSDKDWMDLDSRVEITIGPYETYEDELLGLKASFEAFVTVSDPAASEALAKYKEYLPKMEQHLPVDDSVKTKRGSESPIRVVDIVFTAGDSRKSVQTIAFNLPNDERVRKEKGAKKVLLRNLIETKFERIMKPIGQKVLDPSLHDRLSGDAFFNQVLFHELSHSLGPAFTKVDGKQVEVRVALGPVYTALEECKADAMGAFNILYMIDEGQLPADMREKLLVSYFAGLFRSVRFGVAESHGQGAAIQVNRYLAGGGASFDEAKGVFTIDLAKLEENIGALVHDLVMLQHEGDKAKAEAFVAEHGVMSPSMEKALAGLTEIPVDIRPVYPLAGETGPR